MKQLKIMVIVGILILTIFVSGCTQSTTNPSTSRDGLVYINKLVPSVTDIGPNLYFVQCEGYDDCSSELKTFSKTHNITSMSALDDMSYGKTGGYFVVTK